jgi:hypothetical protein
MHQIAKNTNNKDGFLSGRLYLITGNSNIINAAVPQLTPVAYGITSAWTIYGRYTQTTGPRVRPKLAINKISPKMMSPNPKLGVEAFMENPNAIIRHDKAAPQQPY